MNIGFTGSKLKAQSSQPSLLKIALLCCWCFTACQENKTGKGDHYMLIGTYTSNSKSEGIYVYKFNSGDGTFSAVSSVKTTDPSFLAVSPGDKYVYAANELNGKPGMVTAFAFDKKSGQLKELNQQPSAGQAPCYVTTDRSGKWLIVGNYSSGTAGVLALNPDGTLRAPTAIVTHEGRGADSSRQEKPHVHSTVFSPDDKYVFIADLGIDKVMSYSFDKNTGILKATAAGYVATQPGAGPRHFVFHPNGKFAYLMEELSGAVTAYDYDGNGNLKPVQTISALPADYKGPVGSADIHVSPDGKFLYASNRGESNTIAIFSVGVDGKLVLAGHQSTLGNKPRNFNFDPSGNFLLVANQGTDNIVVFKVDKQTGKLTPLPDQVKVPSPVCIKWID